MNKIILNNKNPNLLVVKNDINSIKGFTLIELMVATTIFITIMLVAIGSLSVSNATSKKAQQLGLAMDNVNFAMESMTRSFRMGSNYICLTSGDIDLNDDTQAPVDCSSSGEPGFLVAFKPSTTMNINSSPLIAYKLNDNGTWSSLQRCEEINETNTCVDVTSKNVNIDTLKFFVTGAQNISDGIQPNIYIIIKGTVTAGGESSSFAIQTMASQRSTEQ